jgi:RNA polymerase sigma-70 factor (ECF subfamily)
MQGVSPERRGVSERVPPPPTESQQLSGEEEFLRRLRAGDPAAFEALVRAEAGKLLAVTRRILRHEEEARDAVQETFIAAFQRLSSFQGECRLSTWLFRIAANAALMRLRRRRRRPEESIEELLPRFLEDGHRRIPEGDRSVPAPDRLAERQQLRLRVRACIDALPETYRVVLLLRDIEERSTEEVAEIVGATPNAVKIRLHRARQALRELLVERHRELLLP